MKKYVFIITLSLFALSTFSAFASEKKDEKEVKSKEQQSTTTIKRDASKAQQSTPIIKRDASKDSSENMKTEEQMKEDTK